MVRPSRDHHFHSASIGKAEILSPNEAVCWPEWRIAPKRNLDPSLSLKNRRPVASPAVTVP